MQNYVENMWCSFFVLDQKNPFWANLVKKKKKKKNIKIVSLSGNLLPRSVWICRINDDVRFFSFWLEKPFWANLVKKIKIVSLSWNFALDQFKYAELCRKYVVFTSSVLYQKSPFLANLIKKIRIVSFSWNLVPRLIWIWRIQCWYSLFLFLTINIFLGKFGPKI